MVKEALFTVLCQLASFLSRVLRRDLTFPVCRRFAETGSGLRSLKRVEEIAPDVAVVPIMIVNAYLVGKAQSWVLVDSGTPGNEDKVQQAAEARFGSGAKPNAIVLTHGHFDHAGSAKALAERWGVRIYAQRLELPYLTGRSAYPPLDPTAPGGLFRHQPLLSGAHGGSSTACGRA